LISGKKNGFYHECFEKSAALREKKLKDFQKQAIEESKSDVKQPIKRINHKVAIEY